MLNTTDEIKTEIKQRAMSVGLDVSAFIDKLDYASLIDLLSALNLMQIKRKLKLKKAKENENKRKGINF